MRAIKICLICGFWFGITFGFSSLIFYFGDWVRLLMVTLLIFYFGDWVRLLMVTLFGFFIGLIAAPEIEPKAFKMAGLVQSFSGLFASGVIGWAFQLMPENILVAIVMGGILGFLAPFWVKYVPIP